MVLLIVVGAAAWGGWHLWGNVGNADEGNRGVQTHTVGRADMLLTVTDDGTLQSAANIDVKCEVAGGGTILWLVQDGKNVEAGEKVIEFDPAAITDQLNLQKSVFEKATALKIQAEQNLAAAEIAVREYKEGTYLQSVQTADSAIQIAQQNLSSAQNTYEFTQRMVRKGFATQLQLDADQFAVQRAQLDLDAAITTKRVLQDFTYEKTVKQLEATREAAEAQLRAETATLSNEETHLRHLELQLSKCTVVAPAAGMVVYANDNRSRWGSSEPDIYEGAVVRDRQSILRLPDLKSMQVKTTVHESKVDQIRAGMPARVVIQGRPFTGHVVSMANQPESQSFMSANVKEYATLVAIDGSPTGLRPGMTAEVTILIAEVKSAVTLPVTAVVEKRDGYYGYVQTPTGIEERKLKIGLTNDTYLVVEDGVKEGDVVVRNPRAVVPAAREEVSLSERTASRDQFGEGQTAQADNGGSGGREGGGGRQEAGGEGGGERRRERPNPAQLIKQSDTNGDGKLSKDEAAEPLKTYFDMADTDKDGFITTAELAAGMKAMGGGGGGGQRSGGEGGGRGGETSGQPAAQPAGAAQ
ncbi:MAG: hypothetical protein JNG89_19600 [Planctomycetaceae bacterium]|nr:hypothetical protein [Planctomycetaceae bacterium]